jgi:hypothetical protein
LATHRLAVDIKSESEFARRMRRSPMRKSRRPLHGCLQRRCPNARWGTTTAVADASARRFQTSGGRPPLSEEQIATLRRPRGGRGGGEGDRRARRGRLREATEPKSGQARGWPTPPKGGPRPKPLNPSAGPRRPRRGRRTAGSVSEDVPRRRWQDSAAGQ